jgi:hypothetical protein
MDMEVPRERWIDEAAGPIVRPYAMTRGRTRPWGDKLDLVTILVRTGRREPEHLRLSPEQRRLLQLSSRPCTIADLASDLDLPLGVTQVLLGDLLHEGLLEIRQAPQPAAGPGAGSDRPDSRLLMRVLDDLRAL